MTTETEVSRTTNDSLPWHARAYAAYQSESPTVQREFASSFIDEYVRAQLSSGRATISVQNGLDYQYNIDDLVDGLCVGVKDVKIAEANGAMGATQLQAEFTAYTYDRAKITHTPGPATHAQQPSFENTTRVRCDLGVGASFAQIVGADIHCSVYVPDPDE